MGLFYTDISTIRTTSFTLRPSHFYFHYCFCHCRRPCNSSLRLYHSILPKRVSVFIAPPISRWNYCRSASGPAHHQFNLNTVLGFSFESAYLTLTVRQLDSCRITLALKKSFLLFSFIFFKCHFRAQSQSSSLNADGRARHNFRTAVNIKPVRLISLGRELCVSL